jgi:organic radical activating enzyme
VIVGERAIMTKTCPTHGTFTDIVENNGRFYEEVQNNLSTLFYDGMIIDATYKCNLRCKWCFQHLRDEEPTIESIITLANTVPRGYPIILSGGEPTLRKDLPELVRELFKDHPVVILTNGYNIDWSLPCVWVLSYHVEGQAIFDKAIYSAIENKRHFRSMIFTIDDLAEMPTMLDVCLSLRYLSEDFRLHIASPVGADIGKEPVKFFCSDMFDIAKNLYGERLQWSPTAKTIYVPIAIDGVIIMLIAWQDAGNIDLEELDCPPWYHDSKGRKANLIPSLVRNGIYRSN